MDKNVFRPDFYQPAAECNTLPYHIRDTAMWYMCDG